MSGAFADETHTHNNNELTNFTISMLNILNLYLIYWSNEFLN
jgi:hypothetical protein